MKRAVPFVLVAALAAAVATAAPEVSPCGPAQEGWRMAPGVGGGATPDLRFLNHFPAGRHGFVQARGEALVFSDGAPARFWGTNVAAKAIFETPDAAIDEHALRLARLGFNLVRLHHHDSGAWQRRTVLASSGAELLDPVAMRKLDRWIARLAAQGVYVWLDLHTGRVFREDEAIPGFRELASPEGPAKAKGFLYLNPRLEELTLRFADAFLAHRNLFTGRRYRDEPAVVALLVTNENDLSHHFGNLFTQRRGRVWHRARFLEAAEGFAKRTGFSSEALQRTWEPGASKLLLADIEQQFDSRVRTHLRREGVRVPIALTSYWGRSGLNLLASLSQGDLIDVHAYAGDALLRSDPRRQLGFLGWIASGQLAGKPLSVTEWNLAEPLQQGRYAAPLWVASIAALQEWDALMLFAYAQQSLASASTQTWNAAIDPALIALMPAAALLYRRGDVAAARKLYAISPSREDLFFRPGVPASATAIASLVERSRVTIQLPKVPELPWLAPPGPVAGERVSDLSRNFLPTGAQRVRSDTGEVERDFERGILRVDTSRSQLAVGAIAGRVISLSSVRIAAQSDQAVAFSSLDGEPLEHSQRILVSVAARACSPGPNATHWVAEPVSGRAWVQVDGARQLTPLAAAGQARRLAREEYGLAVPLDFGASWGLIEPVPAESAP